MAIARRWPSRLRSAWPPAVAQPATSRASRRHQKYDAVKAQLAGSEIAVCSGSAEIASGPLPLDERIAPALHAGAWANLLARMSHDFRTPLNAVIGFSDLMQRELFGPLGDARYQEYVRHIRDSGDQLLRAAEDTLAMTTLVASKSAALDRVDLAALLADTWNELTGQAHGRGIALELAVAPNIEIRAEPRAMRQVLKHLLAAALLRTPAGARLRITAAAAHGRVWIELLVPELADTYVAAPASLQPGCGSEDLHLCVARTLLELQGSTLIEQRRNCSWAARTELEHAVQGDFFAHAH
jgi:hypothetical protein